MPRDGAVVSVSSGRAAIGEVIGEVVVLFHITQGKREHGTVFRCSRCGRDFFGQTPKVRSNLRKSGLACSKCFHDMGHATGASNRKDAIAALEKARAGGA